jgi:hypothetical protein
MVDRYSTTDPCNSPRRARLEDNPLSPVRLGSWLYSIYAKSFEQEFETCAVCLAGNEGPLVAEFFYPDFGGTWKVLNGLTVYGCVRWGHTFRSNVWPPTSRKDYTTTRWMNGWAPKHGSDGGYYEPGITYVGESPSVMFADTVIGTSWLY